MRIEIIGDDSVSFQARTYAEYRLFAALPQVVDTSQVRSASLLLRRAKSRRHCDGTVCTVLVELNTGEVARVRALGTHPYAAINRAVERLRLSAWRSRQESARPETIATTTDSIASASVQHILSFAEKSEPERRGPR